MATVTVLTTLPNFEDGMIQAFRSKRLIMRPLLHPTDLEAYRTIRSQPAAMTGSRTGLPDDTIEQTEAKLMRLQPPYSGSHVYFGVYLKGVEGAEGELIGDGGVHKFSDTQTGWPEFGYKFKQEYWGQGYASEFALSFVQFWCSLPRAKKQAEVALNSVVTAKEEVALSGLIKDKSTPLRVEEIICAWTTIGNKASQRVLQKTGFQSFDGPEDGFVHWRRTLPRS
ncbi:GNAT domain-containing protein [Truncatella angustata]|uniref:GNAT domain-containing protein n=1 Tax=Truncatella angustata TaxID=152316 RepID=A0A9P8UYC1_9PEZI|nr:GNAT domain-containing protein [Truncatella angustata]KAH6660179.1 GNAT domain-containing protein [Truncatella angustata]KAH8201024.1 hypothetical protein TruAng_004797 [Truncatella angustata]